MKYTINHTCGHTSVANLYGSSVERANFNMEKKIIEHLEAMCDATVAITIVSIADVGDDAKFVKFSFDDEECTAVYYPADDILFTPDDWQGAFPRSLDDIPDYRWISSSGDDAIVFGGLPRLFDAVKTEARREFGAKVRALRLERGMTADDLARFSGLLPSHILRIESGRYGVTLDTITRLRAVFGEDLI